MSASETPAGPLPGLVRSRVAFAHRGLASVHVLQGLCCGLACGALALAAGVHAGRALGDPGLWTVAGVDALLVGAALAWERRRSPAQVARRVDSALEFEGALVTAWEVEGRARPGLFGARLGREVAARASGREMLRAALPSSAPFLALPFVAAALLFAALERARYEPSALDLEALVGDVRSGLASISEGNAAGEEGAALSREQEEELRELLRRAGQLQREVPEGELEAEAVEELQERVTELARELGDDARARRELERSLGALDAARMALEGREAVAASEGGDPAEEGAGGGSQGSGLAPGGEDGRMSGQVFSPDPPSELPEAGVLGARAWPRGYEGLVRRWVESRRADPRQD